jgi:hypothetical protein
MKEKMPFIILLALFTCNIGFLKAQVVLVKNAEHVISYEVKGKNIVFTIEDLKDNENNLFITKHGGYVKDYEESKNYKYKTMLQRYDGTVIEFDCDGNNLLETGLDMAYTIYETPSIVAHGLHMKLGIFSGVAAYKTDSESTGKGMWRNSKLYYTYQIPLSEIMDKETLKVKMRFAIQRVAETWDKRIKYGIFIYPEQDVAYKNNKFLTIDLSTLDNDYIRNIKKEILDKENSFAEYTKTHTTNDIDFDGFFIVLVKGKYIEVLPCEGKGGQYLSDINATWSIFAPTRWFTVDNNIPLVNKVTKIIVKGTDFSSPLINNATFLRMEKVPLNQINRFYYKRKLFQHKQDYVYAGKLNKQGHLETINLRQRSISDNHYELFVTQTLESGFYALFINSKFYMIKIK